MTKKNEVAQQHHATFEGIRQVDAEGQEYWLARDLAHVLDYPQWRNFLPVLDKARAACANCGQAADDHFADIRKMVDIGSGAQREVEDVRLTRYASYLIVQNADPSKPVIANLQIFLNKMGIENPLAQQHLATFEGIRQTDAEGHEHWLARDLAKVLEYSQYRHFLPVLDRAKEACRNSGQPVEDHMEDVLTMVEIGSGAKREVEDIRLSRYACYLIVQNADPSKSVIANGQTYFAIQTRRQELADDQKFAQLSEDEKRLAIRNELAAHNKYLAAAAKDAGVESPLDYAIFQDHGYKGLYGGMGAKDIHAQKGLKKSQKILDHMGSTELAANLFRATQAEEKLRRDQVQGKRQANQTHYEVGSKVRQTIADLGGTMPEQLPKPEASIQQLTSNKKKLDR